MCVLQGMTGARPSSPPRPGSPVSASSPRSDWSAGSPVIVSRQERGRLSQSIPIADRHTVSSRARSSSAPRTRAVSPSPPPSERSPSPRPPRPHNEGTRDVYDEPSVIPARDRLKGLTSQIAKASAALPAPWNNPAFQSDSVSHLYDTFHQ